MLNGVSCELLLLLRALLSCTTPPERQRAVDFFGDVKKKELKPPSVARRRYRTSGVRRYCDPHIIILARFPGYWSFLKRGVIRRLPPFLSGSMVGADVAMAAHASELELAKKNLTDAIGDNIKQ